jgi:hypothetical protein
MAFECSTERPWGVHLPLRNDEDCPRCGWTAPGPASDARLDALYEAQEREWLRARALEFGLIVLDAPPKDRLAA